MALAVLLLTACSKTPPEIFTISPKPATVGGIVKISGQDFPNGTNPKVSIGGQNATVLTHSATEITVRVPEGSESGGISVDFGAGLTDERNLTVSTAGAAPGNTGNGGSDSTTGASAGTGAALEPAFKSSLKDLTFQSGGTAPISNIFDPKTDKAATAAAQTGGFTGAYSATYKGQGLVFANMTGIQMSSDQGAQDLATAWETSAEDPYKTGYKVHKESGTLPDGTAYSGFSVPITSSTNLVFLVATKGSTVFSVRLVGSPDSADAKSASGSLGTVVAAAP